MDDDVKEVATWLGILGSIIGVLAFFGISSVDDVERVLSGPTTSAQPTSTDTSYAAESDYSSESSYTAEETSTEDPGCEAASGTIHAYTDLISTDNDEEATAGVFDDMASAFDSDAVEAEDSEVESTLEALAADARAASRALPRIDQSDVSAYNVASQQLRSDLEDLETACGWS